VNDICTAKSHSFSNCGYTTEIPHNFILLYREYPTPRVTTLPRDAHVSIPKLASLLTKRVRGNSGYINVNLSNDFYNLAGELLRVTTGISLLISHLPSNESYQIRMRQGVFTVYFVDFNMDWNSCFHERFWQWAYRKKANAVSDLD